MDVPAKSSSGTGCTTAVFNGAPYGLCSNADDPTTGTNSLLRLDPADGTPHEVAQLQANVRPLGVVGGKPLLLAPNLKEYQSAPDGDRPYAALLRVDPSTGKVQRLPLEAGTRGTATLVGGVVYFVRPNGTVIAVRGTDGTRL